MSGKILNSIIFRDNRQDICPTVRARSGLSAAIAVGFLMIFNEASYQKQALRRVSAEYQPRDGRPHDMACAFHTAQIDDNWMAAKVKTGGGQEPLFADEMIAVVKDLAHRVVEGEAHVSDLMSMLESLEKMGIDVDGLFSDKTTMLGPRFCREAGMKRAA